MACARAATTPGAVTVGHGQLSAGTVAVRSATSIRDCDCSDRSSSGGLCSGCIPHLECECSCCSRGGVEFQLAFSCTASKYELRLDAGPRDSLVPQCPRDGEALGSASTAALIPRVHRPVRHAAAHPRTTLASALGAPAAASILRPSAPQNVVLHRTAAALVCSSCADTVAVDKHDKHDEMRGIRWRRRCFHHCLWRFCTALNCRCGCSSRGTSPAADCRHATSNSRAHATRAQ